MDDLVTSDAEDRPHRGSPSVSASTTICMNPCVSPFSTARPTLVIDRLPTSARRPDART